MDSRKEVDSVLQQDCDHDENNESESTSTQNVNLSASATNISVTKDASFYKQQKDFRQSVKYEDCDSYVSQHHHFIGTGLFNTDEIEELPPRFRKKVIRALEVAAAELHIPINDPVALLNSVSIKDSHSVPSYSGTVQTYTSPAHETEINVDERNLHLPSSSLVKAASCNESSNASFPKTNVSLDIPNCNTLYSVTEDNICNNAISKSNKSSYVHTKYLPLTKSTKTQQQTLPSEIKTKHFSTHLTKNSNLNNLDTGITDISNENKTFPSKLGLNDHQSAQNKKFSKIQDKSNFHSQNVQSKNELKKSRNILPELFPNIDSANKSLCSEKDCVDGQKSFAAENKVKSTERNNSLPKKKLKSSEEVINKCFSKTKNQTKTKNVQKNSESGHKNINSMSFKNNSFSDVKESSKNLSPDPGPTKKSLKQSHFTNKSNNKFNKNETHYLEQNKVFLDSLTGVYSDHYNTTSTIRQNFEAQSKSLVTKGTPKSFESVQMQSPIIEAFKEFKKIERTNSNISDFSNESNISSKHSSSSHNSQQRQNFCSQPESLVIKNRSKYNAEKNETARNQSLNSDSCISDFSKNSRKGSRNNSSSNFSDRPSLSSKYPSNSCSSSRLSVRNETVQNQSLNRDFIISDSSKDSHKRSRTSSARSNFSDQSSLSSKYSSNSCGSSRLSEEYANKMDNHVVSQKGKSKLISRKHGNNSSQNPKFSRTRSNCQHKKLDARNDVISLDYSSSQNSMTKQNSMNLESFASTDINRNSRPKCYEYGFFLKVEVIDNSKLDYWLNFLKSKILFRFYVEFCCKFSETLIITFDTKYHGNEGLKKLLDCQRRQSSSAPRIYKISNLKTRLVKPCDCEQVVIKDSIAKINQYAFCSLRVVKEKMLEIESELKQQKGIKLVPTLNRVMETLESSISNFNDFKDKTLLDIENAENLQTVQKKKLSFIRECNTFNRCLPIYSKKSEILHSIRFHSVSIVIADTGSGKSTQLVEYLLYSGVISSGIIICTQPRKLAAISIAQFVSQQLGSAVGKVVGYDVGLERKCSNETKIIFMTDFCLLKTFLRNKKLTGISCVIIDEAHERSLYTDLLLGMLKKCLKDRIDLRVVITSATIQPNVFVDLFDIKPEAVIRVPGRLYPVNIIWWQEDVNLGWNYIEACVGTAYKIHKANNDGDILVFLTSPAEIEEAINLFKRRLNKSDKMPRLFCLHGKSDVKEQVSVFHCDSKNIRRIIFATNVAETSVTIPNIKYVVDSGMAKEMKFDPKRNKNYLEVTFISKSSAEQRSGRAGRVQSGVCYRLYSKKNFNSMLENTLPDILKTNLQKALLKVYELGINPEGFEFPERPSDEIISKSIASLTQLGAIKNKHLTPLGKKLVKLPMEPQLSKFILKGVEVGISFECIAIAAMITESSKLFIRYEDNKDLADEKKITFCQEGGDLCTYLEIYKQYHKISREGKFDWCARNYISSKALNAVQRTVREIIFCLHTDLSVTISKTFNDLMFKKCFERIVFDSFSDNLCILSGHPKLGYLSHNLSESFFIHPSSTLSYLDIQPPQFLVYSTLMETSRNYLFDVTPISEETINLAYQDNSFNLPVHALKSLQIPPKILGPYGESVLIRYILGKQGSKIIDLESKLKNLTRTKCGYVDVTVDKGLITLYLPMQCHAKAVSYINEITQKAHEEMLKEEDVVKFTGTSVHYCIGAGAIISDIILPGEFRKFTFKNIAKYQCEKLKLDLVNFDALSCNCVQLKDKNLYNIFVTFKTVEEASNAFKHFEDEKYDIESNPYLPNVSNKSLPLYFLEISWCRLPCIGNGWVEFESEEDCVYASGTLSLSSFHLDENYIIFTPTHRSVKILKVENLPKSTNEDILNAKLKERLKNIAIKHIKLVRKEAEVSKEEGLKKTKMKVQNMFERFVDAKKFLVDVKSPKAGDINWNVLVYFYSVDDGELAFQKLKNTAIIDSCPVTIVRNLKLTIYCSKKVYKKIQQEVCSILEKEKSKGNCETFCVKPCENTVSIEFFAKDIPTLMSLRKKLKCLLQGEVMDCKGNTKYNILFTLGMHKRIETIANRTNTVINCDIYGKIISIFGNKNSIQRARTEIYSLAHNEAVLIVVTFNLKGSCVPSGFLKCMYDRYGYGLHGLIDAFQLNDATVDCEKHTLTLKGDKTQIKKAEQELEKICAELDASKKGTERCCTSEECPICLDPVSYDYYRLEHCGHACCRQCLLLQLESKTIPLVCAKLGCEKLIFLEDIKRIITFGASHLKKAISSSALKYFVSCNAGKVNYCPTPDCSSIYRVTKREVEYQCPICNNVICSHCQEPYHYGMSCDMYQNCKDDEDYSLKSWVKKNEAERKYCPSCKAVIEKQGGCNHMECLNCKVHLCWLCLKMFSAGDAVHSHLPYCPKNQS